MSGSSPSLLTIIIKLWSLFDTLVTVRSPNISEQPLLPTGSTKPDFKKPLNLGLIYDFDDKTRPDHLWPIRRQCHGWSLFLSGLIGSISTSGSGVWQNNTLQLKRPRSTKPRWPLPVTSLSNSKTCVCS